MNPGIFMEIGLVCKDASGVVTLSRSEPAHSFTRNFARALNASFRGAMDYEAYTDIDGVKRQAVWAYYASSTGYPGWGVYPGGTSPLAGIIVGSSDAAFSPDQYNLGSPILHGTGVGELQYGVQSKPVVIHDDVEGSVRLEMSRDFLNDSGGVVSVSEVGLMGRPRCGDAYTSSVPRRSVLLTRDVLEQPVNVPVGETLVVTHIIKVML